MKDKEEKTSLMSSSSSGDEEKGKKAKGDQEKKESKGQPSSSSAGIMAAMRAKFQAIGDGVKARTPQIPSRREIAAKMWAKIPSIPRPNVNLPELPQVS